MGIFHHDRGNDKRPRQTAGPARPAGARLAALLLCLSVLTGALPLLARAADGRLSGIVQFDSITLHHAGADGQSVGAEVQDRALLKKDEPLILRYTYTITEEQCRTIQAGTNYYLEVSDHLVLPNLGEGAALTIQTDDGDVPFGKIHADGSRAWVTFDAKENGTDTVLSDYGELRDAYFYLHCRRAGDVPADATEQEKNNNLYAMKFENGGQLDFGYAENQPLTAKAQIDKAGSLTGKTITWTIDYMPWQNPAPDDPVTADTPFELRDTIDPALHHYVPGSVTINGTSVTDSDTRPAGEQATYVLVETLADGKTVLTFGGTEFDAGKATQGDPATPLKITYQTAINDALLLPGGTDGRQVTNAAELFAGKSEAANSLHIRSSAAVTVSAPTWLSKTGATTRDYPNGSYTDWTVTFMPNGFRFDDTSCLTLHDQLPAGSALVAGSVKVDGTSATATAGTGNDFTISSLTTTDNRPVTITYQTRVPEEMYDSGTSLGKNTAWFTFQYGGKEYTTPQVDPAVGSGSGNGTSDTATLVKANGGYDARTRSISWTVTINPHKANLQGGTFTDRLGEAGPPCAKGHPRGLDLVDGTSGITILVDGQTPTAADSGEIDLAYTDQVLTITVGDIGPKTIALTYTTKVCDPCIFANNTEKTPFQNTVSTHDMIIGSPPAPARNAVADSTADVSATVLTKQAPVYDYASGRIKWTIDVDAAGLPMADVVLTDDLPAGLTYVQGSFATAPAISGATAAVRGQTLTLTLGTVSQKTTVTFDTAVLPETLGFGGGQPVVVKNTVRMNGKADEVVFAEVSHSVQQRFSNHGLVKSSAVNDRQEFIQYEVLINPYHLALPDAPSLVDTLDKRLQLDTDTLVFYPATVTGTTGTDGQQTPAYQKVGSGQKLEITDFDLADNRFTVQLPVAAGDRDAYVLTYTADIIDHQAGAYGNSVRFDGSSVLLGGSKNNSAAVGGGGGGGGSGVAARKATISLVKTDSETQTPLAGVSFILYQWAGDRRGLPFAQGMTDAEGKLSFRVKPDAVYELVEAQSAPGYDSALHWTSLPAGAEKTDGGLRITAGAARSTLTLHLTNDAHTTDIVFRLVNGSGIPMAGAAVKLFAFDPTGATDPTPAKEATVSAEGTVRFAGVRRGARYYLQRPDGGVMTVDIPASENAAPTLTLPDGVTATLHAGYQATGVMPPEQQWALTVSKTTGEGAPLAGATIGLYADEACRSLIKTGVSGQDGTVTFPGLLKGQSYWLKEIAAPQGYQLNTTIYKGTEDAPDVTSESVPSPAAPGQAGPVGPAVSANPAGLPAGLPDPNAPNAPEQVTIVEDGVAKTYRKVWNTEKKIWVYILHGTDAPPTGDAARELALAAMAALISGLALAALMAYQYREKWKKE